MLTGMDQNGSLDGASSSRDAALAALRCLCADALASPAVRLAAAKALLAATAPPSPWTRPSRAKDRPQAPAASPDELAHQLAEVRRRKRDLPGPK